MMFSSGAPEAEEGPGVTFLPGATLRIEDGYEHAGDRVRYIGRMQGDTKHLLVSYTALNEGAFAVPIEAVVQVRPSVVRAWDVVNQWKKEHKLPSLSEEDSQRLVDLLASEIHWAAPDDDF